MQQGYTIIELLFAVANFTFIVMIAITAFVVVMRIYNKSNFSRKNQQSARNIVYQLENDIKYASVRMTAPGGTNDLCLVNPDAVVRYLFAGNTISRGEIVMSPSGTIDCDTISVSPITPDGYVIGQVGTTSVFRITPVRKEADVVTAIVDISFTSSKGTSADPTDPFHDELTVSTAVIARDGIF